MMDSDRVPKPSEVSSTYDAIIIGAGLSGLTVGSILAYNKYRVLILDKNHQPGGCVVNFQRKDYRFDTAIHFINGCGPGGMVHTILKTFGGENVIEWLPITNLVHWKDNGLPPHVSLNLSFPQQCLTSLRWSSL